MGLSRAFGCFKDPEARALKKQMKAGNRTRNEEAQPNRVIAAAGRSGQAGIPMRNLPAQSPLPTTMAMRNDESPPLALEYYEPEPWSMGAVIRRTALIQAELAKAANERKQAEEELDVKNSQARSQAIVEEDVEMPPGTITEENEEKETGTGGGGVRATMMFGLPTTRKGPGVDLRAVEEEAEIRQFTEESNALASKGSHNGKFAGAVGWNPVYSQRATPVSLHSRDTRKSGWGRPGPSGSFGAAVDEPYYDYEIGISNGTARSSVGSNSYGAPYGYGYARKGNSHYAYVSGPAN